MKTKNIICVLFWALLLFSCSSVKKTAKVATKLSNASETNVSKAVESNTVTNIADNSTVKDEKAVSKSIDQIETETGKLEGSLKTYDTSLPLDPTTGKPPLLSELTFSNLTTKDNQSNKSETTNGNSVKVTDLKTAIQAGLKVKVDKTAETKVQAEEAIQTTEIRKSNNLWWILIIVAIVGGAVYFFGSKIPFVSILSKVKSFFTKK